MNIQERLTEIYTKMNYEYTQDLIKWNLALLFSLYTEEELEAIYEEQLKQYNSNKQHYDNKPFTYNDL